MLLDILPVSIDVLYDELFLKKEVTVSVLRLDKIHPIASGNKLFKLHFFLQQALLFTHKTILTFGGAYSNHLIATAYACHDLGLKSIGVIRGEKPVILSHTLQDCINFGMQLHFVSREDYAKKNQASFIKKLVNHFGECIIVPEGGANAEGANGAALICDLIPPNTYSHIFTATGTATTLAGILQKSSNEKIIAIPVLKGINDIEERINYYNKKNNPLQLDIFNNYHFGGYAKKNTELLSFMNYIWIQHKLPTDFVYSAKMFFAVYDKIKSNYFKPNSKILCIHNGGLQGNLSLPKNTLLF